MLSCAKVKSWQIWGCVNSDPKVPALTTAITHPLSGGGWCFLSSTQTPSMKSRGQTDSCCCYFLSLGTSLMLQSQSPSREDGVSLRRGRSSRWVCVALHFLKCGRIFSDHRRPYLCDHGPALHHLQKPDETHLISHICLCLSGRCILGNATVSQARRWTGAERVTQKVKRSCPHSWTSTTVSSEVTAQLGNYHQGLYSVWRPTVTQPF